MISRKLSARSMLACASMLCVPVPRPARAAEPAANDANDVENEKARQTFKEGIAAFDRRDFEAARVAFLQTFALKPSAPVVRRNLGLAEIYSGHYLEGARRLGRVIHTTDEGTSMDRARMVESLKKAEAHLERVTVEVNVEGAQITIGEVDLGQSPMRFAWYMEPGSYDVRISKPGFIDFSETRMARAGSAEHLRINLRPVVVEEPVVAVAASEPVSEPVPPPQVDHHSGPNPWVLATGGLLTAGGLAAGLTLSLFAADNADKVQQIGDSLGGMTCRAPLSPQCVELSDAAAAHDQQVRWATVSFALGAAAGVSTLVYALLASSDRSSHAASASASLEARSVGVSVEDGGPRLLVTGTF
jgi:PEGA domain-containing protein